MMRPNLKKTPKEKLLPMVREDINSLLAMKLKESSGYSYIVITAELIATKFKVEPSKIEWCFMKLVHEGYKITKRINRYYIDRPEVKECIIFVGLQASGKSTFFKQQFTDEYERINLDMLKTRKREDRFLQEVIEDGKPFVIDNTNPTPEERAKYISLAKKAGYRVVAYYFRTTVDECKHRNACRKGNKKVPMVALYTTRKKMVLPTADEGFDAIYYVKPQDGTFEIEEIS